MIKEVCASFLQPAHEKIGVVDSQYIVHKVVPSLGNQVIISIQVALVGSEPFITNTWWYNTKQYNTIQYNTMFFLTPCEHVWNFIQGKATDNKTAWEGVRFNLTVLFSFFHGK